MSKCVESCKLPTPAQAHCPTCHRTFGGASGFDDHRRHGFCLNPAGLGMVLQDDQVWRTPMDQQSLARLRGLREGNTQ